MIKISPWDISLYRQILQICLNTSTVISKTGFKKKRDVTKTINHFGPKKLSRYLSYRHTLY